jgi:hypothetical protein
MQALKTFLPLFLGAFLAIFFTINSNWQFSTFAFGLSKYALAIGCAWFVDSLLIKEANTREIISSDPIAYSLFLTANILTAALCFSQS